MAPLAAAAVACALIVTAGCKKPVVGEPSKPAGPAGGPAIAITGATIDATGHVVVSFTLSDRDAPVPTRDAALALAPRFTLAALSRHPVDGLAAWKSLVLTGAQLASLPPGGPGTPAGQVLSNVKQPGADAGGTLSGEDGAFTYVFGTALPAGFDPRDTVRVGVWLLGNRTRSGTSTFDFRPAGGAPAPRDTVLDANCEGCHATLLCSPRGAVGVKMCVTCHTWQNADPDTIDPAALDGATAATDPNPLDFGRMIHRIHRGKDLPTLYAASSTAPAQPLPPAAAPALPFVPGRNAPVVGRKYAVVGPESHEVVFGHVVRRTDNGQSPGTVLAAGVVFPRELRDCGACHAGAPQEYEVLYAISRRTCSGCHPDVWFAPPNGDGTTSITDAVHFAHLGGPQPDDTECSGCHVAATATQPKVWAPIAQIHVPTHRSPRFDRPVVEIVGVENLRAGAAPRIKFKLYDRLGTFPQVGAFPAPAPTPGGSVLPRTMHYYAGGWFGITVAGPTEPAFGLPYLLSERENLTALFALTPDANGVFTYPFTATVPADASGTWAVGIEARRAGATTHYDVAAQEFRWPYTGESLTEPPINPTVYVDTATGTFTKGVPDAAVPRRKIVSQEKCNRCHQPIFIHGKTRMQVEYCVVCHGPDRTDWGQRPGVVAAAGVPATGTVKLSATYDNIEERSIDFKVMIHRIHTGGAKGAASLEGIEPHVIYGRYGTIAFLDEGIFPGDLADCTTCHEGRSYLVEAVPPDAPPTRANETATILHAPGVQAHPASEPVIPAIQAACLGCHASGATRDHARRNTVDGVEQCASCHARGAQSVEIAHGLASPDRAAVGSTWSSIVSDVIVPRCASGACHGGSPPPAFPRLDAEVARDAMVDVPSQQAAGIDMVEPFEPARSYLVLKLRGEAGSVGGVATPMPIGDALLEPSEIAAIEAWIANGAPND